MNQTISEQARVAAIAATQVGRTAMKLALRSPMSRWVAGVPTAHHLLILPQDLRTGDPSFAVELYDGYFGLAGAAAPIGSESPFKVLPPTIAWQKELYAFAWLRHLHAAEDQISREKARGLILEWIALGRNAAPIARSVDITARRVIATLSHAAFLLDGADPEFYDAVMRALSRDLHDLTVTYADDVGVPKLRALTAILLAGLCVAEQETYLSSYVATFCSELERQVLEDGCHVSRDPSALIELLLDFLPLKQCFVARQIDVPPALYTAIGRMYLMLRFLRLGDGSVARFNGMGPTLLDQVATVLAYDDAGGQHDAVISRASGYARLAAGQTVVIADVGPPAALHHSSSAHAGCSAFEMSVGYEMLITNCGAPQDDSSDWAVVSRSTAAHSTLTIEDLSSARLIKAQKHSGPREVFWLSGPRVVTAEHAELDNVLSLQVSHDGYRDRFGYTHKRRLTLRKSGLELEGTDYLGLLRGDASLGNQPRFAIRFHLNPRVTVSLSRNMNAVLMTMPNGSVWRFVSDVELDVEESIFFADPICLRRSLQIVLKGFCAKDVAVSWKIERADTPRQQVSDQAMRRSAPREE